MLIQERIKILVGYTHGNNPVKSAIAKQILCAFEEIKIIDIFFEDFCSSALDEQDISQLLGADTYEFYMKNKKFINTKSDTQDWLTITRTQIKNTLKELMKELDVVV